MCVAADNGCGDEFVYTTPTDPRNKNLLEVCDEGAADSTTCLGTTPFGAIPAEQWEFLQCTPSACGDGVVNPAAGETCDPGDDEDCPSTCVVATCGDGNPANDGARSSTGRVISTASVCALKYTRKC